MGGHARGPSTCLHFTSPTGTRHYTGPPTCRHGRRCTPKAAAHGWSRWSSATPSGSSSPGRGPGIGSWSGRSSGAAWRRAPAPSAAPSAAAVDATGGGEVPVYPFLPHLWPLAGPACHQPGRPPNGPPPPVPTGLGLGVGTLRRRSPLRKNGTRLATVGLLAVQLLDLPAVPARPGQPPPPGGDPGPQPAPDHHDGGDHAQPAQPPPPTSIPGPPATPGHDHVLPLHRSQGASIARRQQAAYPRLRRCRAATPRGTAARLLDGLPPRPCASRVAALMSARSALGRPSAVP